VEKLVVLVKQVKHLNLEQNEVIDIVLDLLVYLSAKILPAQMT
jgi:hypothetical protein